MSTGPSLLHRVSAPSTTRRPALARLANGAAVCFVDGAGPVTGSLGAMRAALALERPGRPWGADAAALASVITALAPDDRLATPVAGVRRVPPYHEVSFDAGGAACARPRLPGAPVAPLDRVDAREATRLVADALREAVACAVAGHGRVAVLASGGVDSSALLAATLAEARGANAREVHAIALDFAGPGDDRPYLADLARALDIVPVRVAPESGAAYVRRALVCDEMPYPSADAGYTWALLEAARNRGAEIVLSGIGGDDLFDGDPEVFADPAAGSLPLRLLRAARLRSPWGEPGVSQAWWYALRPRLRPHVPRALRRRRALATWRARWPWAGERLAAFLARRAEEVADAAPDGGAYERFVTQPHLARVLDLREQLAVASGVRRVDPLLDESVVALVASLPPALLLHGGMARGLFREAVRGLVPDRVRLRTDKAGFAPALAAQLRAAGGARAFADLATPRALAALGLVDARRFGEELDRRLGERHGADPAGDAEAWTGLWPVLAAEAFARHVSRDAA